MEPLRNWVKMDKKPVWGTCAGMILLSKEAQHTKQGGQALIGGLNAVVCRNYFGAQVRSFESDLKGPPGFRDKSYKAVFIRAPGIVAIGEEVEVLEKMDYDGKSVVVAAQQVRVD